MAAKEADSGLSLEDLLRDSAIGMAVVGLDGCFRLVNPALCEMLGYRAEELIGKRPAVLTHPEDRPRAEEIMLQLTGGHQTADRVRKRYIRSDGAIVSALRTITILRDRDGRAVGLLSQMVNLTDAVEAEEKLRQSERRFRALVAHASEMTVVVDRSGLISYVSPASNRLLGRPPEEIEGRPALEFIHPDDLRRANARLQDRLSGDSEFEILEYRIRHRDGEWRRAEVVGTNLFEDPSVGAIVLNVRDVTEQRQYQKRLEASERRFRSIVGNSWDIISLHGPDGRYLYCSPAVKSQMGYDPDELVGMDPLSFVHRDDAAAVETYREVLCGVRQRATLEYRFPHRDGSWRWIESVADNRRDDPSIEAVVVTSRDVTSSRRRAAQQDATAALSSLALQGGPMRPLFDRVTTTVAEVLEADGCFVLVDRREDGPQKVASAPLDRDSGSENCRLSRQALEEGRSIIWNQGLPGPEPRHADPAPPGGSGAAILISPGAGGGGVLTAHSGRSDAFSRDDLSFLESLANVLAAALTRSHIEEELRRQAVHDSLTGLPNRVLITDRLERSLARLDRARDSVAVLFVDLDNFKLVNDSLGHSAGDSVVTAIAARIAEAARTGDTVARFGGDEFVVIAEGVDEAAAQSLAERIRHAVSLPMVLHSQTVAVTASVGFAVADRAGISSDDLLARADMAMYQAKQAGKDCSAPFEASMRERVTLELETVSGIRRGLAENEFRLHYQPIIDTRQGCCAGYEALVRWQHPVSGLLGPNHFIEHAEGSGLIVPLGEWVLETACRQSAQWRREGRPAAVSINVSTLQLTGSDIVSVVRGALESSGADPRDISLEVTESAVMADLDRATSAIESLRRLGVHVGMDDFGTGHSSLSNLARLPFDFVKIDRSFIRDFDRDARTLAMLESVTTLCRSLQLHAIAEGVETEEQLAQLEQLGIFYIQGFLFSRPVPPEDVGDVAISHARRSG